MFVIDFVTHFTVCNQHGLPTRNPQFPPEPPTLLGVVGDCWIEKKGVKEVICNTNKGQNHSNHMQSVGKTYYPISTLPEHLHSTSLSYAETTLNSKKLVSFPLIAHYLSAGPPLPPTPPSPGDPATPTLNHHSHFQRPRSRTYFWPLSLVMFASPLRL